MFIYPVVEISGGRCRAVEEGRADREMFPSSEPGDVVKALLDMGANGACIIDVDAARGSGSNLAQIEHLVEKFNHTSLLVGGGIRETKVADRIFMAGADKLLITTGALEDLAFLRNISDTYGRSFIFNLDVSGKSVYTHGRSRVSPKDLTHALHQITDLDIGGIMLTFVTAEGEEDFIDVSRMRWLESMEMLDLYARGRMKSMDDLKKVAFANTVAVLLNEEIYTGKVDVSKDIEA